MDPTGQRLLEETRTWRDRLQGALDEATPATDRGSRYLENIEAYLSDSQHFEDEDDLVRAFEAVVWAWAWLEIGADTGDIDWTYPDSWEGP